MTDHPRDTLDDTITRVAREAFPVPDAPREAMWQAIERARQVDARVAPTPIAPTLVVHRTTYRHRTFAFAAGMAAMLAVGVGIGRQWRADAPVRTPLAATTDDASYSAPDTPRRLTMDAHLARTEILLTTLRSTTYDRDQSTAEFATSAQHLLGTTRQLLDDQALGDGSTRALLLDLELVLAQIVQDAASRQPDASRASRDALIRMNLLPRLRASESTAPRTAFTGPI